MLHSVELVITVLLEVSCTQCEAGYKYSGECLHSVELVITVPLEVSYTQCEAGYECSGGVSTQCGAGYYRTAGGKLYTL